MTEPALVESEIFALERPEPSLLTYYALSSLLLGPFFFFAPTTSTISNKMGSFGSLPLTEISNRIADVESNIANL